MSFHVVFANAPAATRAFDFVNVDAEFAGEPAACAELRERVRDVQFRQPCPVAAGMEKASGRGMRLIGRQRLFFGFALGANRSLERQPRAVLPGDVLDRPALRARAVSARADGAAPFSVKISWPTLIFSPSLTLTSLTIPLTDDGTSTTAFSVSSSMTGWPSETLAPGCNHQAHQVALRDIFSEFL
jgi:hypothetical protein